MNIKDRVFDVLKAKGIRAFKMEEDLGLARGYVSKLDKSSPSSDKLLNIANYLGVSVDYLLDNEKEYYIDPETARIAQEVFDNPNTRVLFDAARDSKPENIRLAAEMLKRFKESNPDG